MEVAEASSKSKFRRRLHKSRDEMAWWMDGHPGTTCNQQQIRITELEDHSLEQMLEKKKSPVLQKSHSTLSLFLCFQAFQSYNH